MKTTEEAPILSGSKPERIQLRRIKGWRTPPNTVRVCRPSRWGNPFRIGWYYLRTPGGPTSWLGTDSRPKVDTRPWTYIRNNIDAVDWYQWYLGELLANNTITGPDGLTLADELLALRGKNLACFCPLGDRCHADVLLRLANPDLNQS
jgi:hypothetical protein